jgi:hypothetical protein
VTILEDLPDSAGSGPADSEDGGFVANLILRDWPRWERICPPQDYEGTADTSSHVVVDTLEDPDLVVFSPFYVEVHWELEEVSAYHADTGIFGIGDTKTEALEDFRGAVASLFHELSEERGSLGPALEGTLRLLEAKVRRR